jgi:DNA-binding response OmpR family regulator
VLCIEDNLSNLQLVERVLSRRPSVKLVSAMRPQLGLDLAAEYLPDLVLLDQGARAFLTKPFNVRELLGLLDAIAEERERAESGSPPRP